MNLDFDLSAVPRFFHGVLTELRQKRLWPVAAVLVVALVAVPVLLASSSSPAPQPQAQVPAPAPAPSPSIPALSVQTSQTHSRLVGPSHDPFAAGASTGTAPRAGSTSTPTATSTAISTATSTTPSNGGSTSTLTGGAPSAGSSAPSSGSLAPSIGSSTPQATPPSITGPAKPKPAPSGLKPTQAYDVALAITNSSGGTNTVDPLERLSVIPSDQQPLLVELGAAQNGKQVLFAVQPGAVLSGPGTCVPGPLDCEILTLRRGQTEQLSQQTGSIGPSQVALFAVTSLTASDYPSVAAASRARRIESAAGRNLLAKSTYPALSLFKYEASLGAVVDLRNLKVGVG